MKIKNKFIYIPFIPFIISALLIISGIMIKHGVGASLFLLGSVLLLACCLICIYFDGSYPALVKALIWRKLTFRDSPSFCFIDTSVLDKKYIGFVESRNKILYAFNNKNIFDTYRDYQKNDILNSVGDAPYIVNWKIVQFQINKKHKIHILVVDHYIFDALSSGELKLKTSSAIKIASCIDEKFICSDMIEEQNSDSVYTFILEFSDDKLLAKFKMNNLNIN